MKIETTRPAFKLDPPKNPPKLVQIDNKTNHEIRQIVPPKPFQIDLYA